MTNFDQIYLDHDFFFFPDNSGQEILIITIIIIVKGVDNQF